MGSLLIGAVITLTVINTGFAAWLILSRHHDKTIYDGRNGNGYQPKSTSEKTRH
jgi:hypothetical protein